MKEAERTGMACGLARAAEGCIALALFVPPFFLGGRCALGQLILAILVSLAAGCVMLSRLARHDPCFSWRAAEFVLPASALVVSLLVWVRLPPALVRAAAPGISRLLPAWTNATLTGLAGGGWPYLSVCPGLSKEATHLFVVYVALFWTTLGSLRTPAAAGRILKIFFLSGLGVAAVGLVHYLFGNGKYYGLWEPWWVKPEHHVRVPFTNRNHFAGYLVLTLAPGTWWLGRLCGRALGGRQARHACETAVANRWPRPANGADELWLLLTGAALALVLAAIVLAQSRAGTLLALATGAVAAAAAGWHAFAGPGAGLRPCQDTAKAWHPIRLSLLALAGVATLALTLSLGREDSFQRLQLLFGGAQSFDELTNHRLRLWRADLHALVDFPLFGSGTGSHSYVVPLYLEQAQPFIYTHAENCYVQVLMECGLLGATLLGAALVALGRRLLGALGRAPAEPRDPSRLVVIAVAISLGAALVHALVDFVWYVPAYAAAVAVLSALACSFGRPYLASGSRKLSVAVCSAGARWLARPALAAIWLVLTVVILRHFAGCVRAEAAWYDYYALLPPGLESRLQPAADTTPARPHPSQRKPLDERARHLQTVCRQRTADPDHYYRLGLIAEEKFSLLAEQKGRLHTLVELRQALEAKAFATREDAQGWLAELYGDDLRWLQQAQAHFRRSLKCCPLLGKGYLRLAELCFLDQVPDEAAAYCRQALQVRPNDATVCLQAGLESWVEGDYVMARQCWQRACRLNPENRSRLLPALASRLSAECVLDLIGLWRDDPEVQGLAGEFPGVGRFSAEGMDTPAGFGRANR